MATFTNPMALLAHQTVLFAQVQEKIKKTHLKAVRGIEEDVRVSLLSGPIKTRELRNMGHPFARRKFSARGFTRERLKGKQRLSTKDVGRNAGAAIAIPLLPINRQTGELAKSAAILRFPAGPGGQELRLAYRAPYAKYILAEKGTSKMVSRGFQAAKKKIDKRHNKALEFEIRRIILNAAASGRA